MDDMLPAIVIDVLYVKNNWNKSNNTSFQNIIEFQKCYLLTDNNGSFWTRHYGDNSQLASRVTYPSAGHDFREI